MKKPNYGIDAPSVVRNLFLAGVFVPILSKLFFTWLSGIHPWAGFKLFAHWGLNLFIGALYALMGFAMVISSKYGKVKQCERLLNLFEWEGNEQVLDVGCGRGLMLIGVAKHLTTGKAVGVDIWDADDLSGNEQHTVLENADIEGVADRVEIKLADARSLPFEDNSFDIIVSNLVIHNIYDKPGREKALLEMVRVLKSGGTMVIQDVRHTEEYELFLENRGLHDVAKSDLQWFIFPPVRVVVATK